MVIVTLLGENANRPGTVLNLQLVYPIFGYILVHFNLKDFYFLKLWPYLIGLVKN